MIKKIVKGIGIFLGVILIVAGLFYTKVYFSTEKRMNRTYHVSAPAIQVSSDSAMLQKGKKLSVVKGCTDCHGADLAGRIMIENFPLGRIVSSNLTRGEGGIKQYTNEDWILALKHGIRKDGKPLIFMPSHEFTLLSEEDMGALIAYVRQVPPVDTELPKLEIGPVARILADVGDFPLVPAEMIDHNRMLVKAVKEEVSLDYGKYLSTSCVGCHKANMKGGEPVAPGFPVVADISSTGNPGKWTDEQFITTLRTGVTPEGKTLDPQYMPWPMAKEMNDTDLKALHQYLTSL